MQGFFTPYVGVVGGLNTTCLVSEVAKPLSSVNTRKNTSVHKGFSKKLENHRALLCVHTAEMVKQGTDMFADDL